MKLEELRQGLELGPTEWFELTQERVNLFADATDDHQWIHTDPARAARESPFGGTIAHGDLTMSLLARFSYELLPVESRLTINYGFNKVRFPAPVPVGSRLRARFRVEDVHEVDGGVQVTVGTLVEREGGEKPVCAAELVLRYLR